jgi:putative copper export protein
VLRTVGRRFALMTATLFVPSQIATGVLLASHYDVTWASLGQPSYGRVLAVKLILFAAVMAAATLHGIAQSRGQADKA